MIDEDLIILGLETSCDETAASVVRRKSQGKGEIISNIVRTQRAEHAKFGGVVPEIAARAHTEAIDKIIQTALSEANIDFKDLSGVAVTAGPGLIGGLLVGMMTAKAIALVHQIPFIAVNHLCAHALTVGLTNNLAPPYMLLLVSGGHTQLQWVKDIDDYTRLGSTIDDALGEAFDKTAKLLGLGFPGGPEVEKWAEKGDPHRFDLPRPLKGKPEANFSFSGLKTALRQQAEKLTPLNNKDISDLCASFQYALIDNLMERIEKACPKVKQLAPANSKPNFVVAGGVAANKPLREALSDFADQHEMTLTIPPANLCTDNAAMIAWAGAEYLSRGISHPLDYTAKSRWPLDQKAPALIGGGKAGVKA